jgi:hypothetical protein
VKSVRRSPNRDGGPPSLAAPTLIAVLVSALTLWPTAVPAQMAGEDDSFEGPGGGPGAPGKDGADSVGGESGESGTNSRGSDGISRTGRSVRGTVIEEGSAEEEPQPPTVTQPSVARRPRNAVPRVAPVQQQQPTADLIPGQPPAPAASDPPERLLTRQPQLETQATSEAPVLAWLFLIAGALLAAALIFGLRRGTGRPGRRSLRDLPA